MEGMDTTPQFGIKKRLRDAIAYVLTVEGNKWPETLRRPTRQEALQIAELCILIVASFVEHVEALMKNEYERVMVGLSPAKSSSNPLDMLKKPAPAGSGDDPLDLGAVPRR